MTLEEELQEIREQIETVGTIVSEKGDAIVFALNKLNETLRNIDTDLQQAMIAKI